MPRKLFVGLFALAALQAVFAGSAQTPPAPPIERDSDRAPSVITKGSCFLKGATILTITQGVIADGSVLVRNGKIAAIGKNLTPPADVPVIDMAGKFIMPGIVDAHAHLASDAVNEGSDSITAEVRIHDVLDPKSVSLYRSLSGGTTTSLVLHGSANAIGGQSAVIKLKYRRPVEELFVSDAPRMVKFALGENVKRSNRTQGAGGGRFPTTRMGVEAVYRRAFAAAKEYQKEWKQYEAKRSQGAQVLPPRRDLRLEALSEILEGKIRVQCHSYRADEMLMMLRLSQEFGFKLVFQHALEAYKIAPEIAAAGVGVSTFAGFWAYKVESYDAIAYNAALCTRAGIVTSLNSDNGAGTALLNLEAASCVKYGGLNETEALKLITLNPAKQLGVDHRTGSLEVGKDADISVWQGHPLSSYSRCVMTLIEGEVFFQRRDAFHVDSQAVTRNAYNTLVSEPFRLPLPKTAKSYAIVGATVHPVSGAEIAEGTVVIENDKIVAVGKKAKIPAGAVVINAKGLHVYPGLIDAGSQIGLTEIGSVPATNDQSEGGDFQPDIRARSAIHAESEHIAITRAAGITATQTYPSGSVVHGQSVLLRLAGWTPEQMQIVDANALHLSFPEGGEVPESVRASLPPDEAQKLVQESAQQNEAQVRRLTEFFVRAERYRALRQQSSASPIDPALEAMIPYLEGKKPVVFHVNEARGIRRALRFAEERKLTILLAEAAEAWRVADQIAKRKVPVILSLPLNNSVADGRSLREFEPYDTLFAAPALLHKAGVRFCFQSGDAAISRNLPGQVAHACAFGLPADIALRAMTLGAAEILGISDRVGSIEAGKQADILITEGDPLDLSVRVRHMFLAGKPVSLESKHTRLYAQFLQRLSEPLPVSPPKVP